MLEIIWPMQDTTELIAEAVAIASAEGPIVVEYETCEFKVIFESSPNCSRLFLSTVDK